MICIKFGKNEQNNIEVHEKMCYYLIIVICY